MSHITQTIKACYDIDKIKELIIADMRKHGVIVSTHDIKEPNEWNEYVRDSGINTVYVRFEGFEVRKEQSITEIPPATR